jgi:DNA modification methylase
MEYRKLKDIKLLDRNPRTIRDDDFKKLVQSIEANPDYFEARPLILSDRTGELVIIAGNQRYRAAKELKLKEVPTFLIKDLTEEREKEIIIRDNVSNGQWDWDLLANDWDVDQLEDWGLDIPNFGTDEILEATEDDFDATPPEEPKTVLGDLYEIGEHRLLCGDSTCSDTVAKLMNGSKADMVFTDPPYGMHLDTDYTKMPNAPNGATPLKHSKIQGDNNDFTPELINTILASFDYCKEIFIWGADYFAELLPNKNDGSWIVWDKRVDEKFDKMIGAAFELCWSKSKHQRKIARINNTLFSGEKDAQNKVHPTQKPIKLATFFFDNWGNQNDLIADLYLGSGSTMVASHQLKRKCYGMELDPKYCDVIVKRLIKLDDKLTVKRNGIDVTNEFK